MSACAIELGGSQICKGLDDGCMLSARPDRADHRFVNHSVGCAGVSQVAFDPLVEFTRACGMLQNEFQPSKNGHVVSFCENVSGFLDTLLRIVNEIIRFVLTIDVLLLQDR